MSGSLASWPPYGPILLRARDASSESTARVYRFWRRALPGLSNTAQQGHGAGAEGRGFVLCVKFLNRCCTRWGATVHASEGLCRAGPVIFPESHDVRQPARSPKQPRSIGLPWLASLAKLSQACTRTLFLQHRTSSVAWLHQRPKRYTLHGYADTTQVRSRPECGKQDGSDETSKQCQSNSMPSWCSLVEATIPRQV